MGCDENRTVDYWNAHKGERNAYLIKCADGTVDRESQSCESARISLIDNRFTFSIKPIQK